MGEKLRRIMLELGGGSGSGGFAVEKAKIVDARRIDFQRPCRPLLRLNCPPFIQDSISLI